MSSKNQYFLLVENIERCQYKRFGIGDLQEGDISSGHVVVRKPCNDANEFEVHRGSQFWTHTPVLVNREGGLPRSKVVAITGREFDILLGTDVYSEDEVRLDLHSGRLKWACMLKDGDAIQVKFFEESAPVAGVIKGTATRLVQHNINNHGLQFIVEIAVKVLFKLLPMSQVARMATTTEFFLKHRLKPRPVKIRVPFSHPLELINYNTISITHHTILIL
jgi:hypothetical protein